MNAAASERDESIKISAGLACAAITVLCAGAIALPCAYGAEVYSQLVVTQPQSYMSGATTKDLFFTLPQGVPLGLTGEAWKDSSYMGPTCWQPITEFAQGGGCNITGVQDRNIGPGNNLQNDINCFGGSYKVAYTEATTAAAKCFIGAIDIISATLNAAQNAANQQREQYYNTVIAPVIAGTAGGISAVLVGISGAFFCRYRKRRESETRPLLSTSQGTISLDPVGP